MANTNAPFGFRPFGHGPGSPPNYELSRRDMLSTNTSPIYRGDPITSSGGYVSQASPGTTQIQGIFWGCKYYSTSQKITLERPYWPGSDAAAGTIIAYVIDDPAAKFVVQATSTAIGIASLNLNAQFTIGTGSAVSGLSGATLDTGTTTNTLPFRIVDLASNWLPPGVNGVDNTTSYNWIVVTFNNVWAKQLTGVSP